jgi:hypothetical protein
MPSCLLSQRGSRKLSPRRTEGETMDYETFAQAIGAASWMLLDTDGLQYVVFLPVYVYLKQSCFGWRVERQPTDSPADVEMLTGGHPSPEAAMAAVVYPLKAPLQGPFSIPAVEMSL